MIFSSKMMKNRSNLTFSQLQKQKSFSKVPELDPIKRHFHEKGFNSANSKYDFGFYDYEKVRLELSKSILSKNPQQTFEQTKFTSLYLYSEKIQQPLWQYLVSCSKGMKSKFLMAKIKKKVVKISFIAKTRNQCKNNDKCGLFQKYGKYDKILNIFHALGFNFPVRQNYLEFCQTSHIPRTDHHNRSFCSKFPF